MKAPTSSRSSCFFRDGIRTVRSSRNRATRVTLTDPFSRTTSALVRFRGPTSWSLVIVPEEVSSMLLRSHQARRARSVAPLRPSPIDPTFAALLRARATWVCRIESALAPLGLSSTEYSVLRCLSDGDGLLTDGDPVALLSTQPSSGLDVSIQRLLAKGLIEPVLARPDGKNARVRITPMGQSRQAVAARALDEVSATFAAMIPDADRAALARIVSSVRGASDGLAAS
jgi:DNA-binding MarR family transcriptional regulator